MLLGKRIPFRTPVGRVTTELLETRGTARPYNYCSMHPLKVCRRRINKMVNKKRRYWKTEEAHVSRHKFAYYAPIFSFGFCVVSERFSLFFFIKRTTLIDFIKINILSRFQRG